MQLSRQLSKQLGSSFIAEPRNRKELQYAAVLRQGSLSCGNCLRGQPLFLQALHLTMTVSAERK